MALFVADATDGDITIAITADEHAATTQHSKKILDAAVHNIIIFFGYHRRLRPLLSLIVQAELD